MTHPALRTTITELFGIEYPIVQTGMGYVSDARLTAATSAAGGLGILASALMSYEELKQAINEHLEETRGHVQRLEEVTGILGIDNKSETCKAMQGLIAEGEEILAQNGDPIAKDAAIIAAAQRIGRASCRERVFAVV